MSREASIHTQLDSGDNADTISRVFERKVALQETSLKAETSVLPRAVPVVASGMAATALTLLGIWDYIPHDTRPWVLGLGILAAAVPAVMTKTKSPSSVTRRPSALEP